MLDKIISETEQFEPQFCNWSGPVQWASEKEKCIKVISGYSYELGVNGFINIKLPSDEIHKVTILLGDDKQPNITLSWLTDAHDQKMGGVLRWQYGEGLEKMLEFLEYNIRVQGGEIKNFKIKITNYSRQEAIQFINLIFLYFGENFSFELISDNTYGSVIDLKRFRDDLPIIAPCGQDDWRLGIRFSRGTPEFFNWDFRSVNDY